MAIVLKEDAHFHDYFLEQDQGQLRERRLARWKAFVVPPECFEKLITFGGVIPPTFQVETSWFPAMRETGRPSLGLLLRIT